MEFYDVGSSDLRELWESYLIEPALGGDVLSMHRDDDWCSILSTRDKSLSVVLRDRLMTDAALGGPRPIKSEHSYSLLTSSPPGSPAIPNGNPNTPNSGSMSIQNNGELHGTSIHGNKVINLRSRIDDMEEECFPAISMNTASGRGSSPPPGNLPINLSTISFLSSSSSNKYSNENENNNSIQIKGEPISAPNSPASSLPGNLIDDKSTIDVISPHRLHFGNSRVLPTSDSEEDDEEYYQRMELEIDPENIEKTENNNRGKRQSLPPTPPSSASSDSEGTASCSPARRDSHSSNNVQNLRGYLGQRLYINSGNSTRQPIHTSLISCQPKGSTGTLTLTEEEKRTLIAEGYPVPTKLPLTKQEEKSLKKVRRKIKNKISAQESRRKKKEYMDGLERRVTMLTNENSSYRDRLTTLEDTNKQLLKELKRLQALLGGQS